MTKSVFMRKLVTALLATFVLGCFTSAIAQEVVTANTQGTHDGFFYSFWTQNPNDGASMTLGPDGNYSTTWNDTYNFTAGKGWRTGKKDRVICFEGTYNGGSNGFLAVYGWTKDPLIEYYVCEKHGDWTPPGNTSDIVYQGEYTCDGGTYKVYTAWRYDKPSIVGNADFQQFWSVRSEMRSSGTVTFEDHVSAWESMGMQMGTTWDYQIMESEGFSSSGNSNITVWECVTNDIEVELTEPAATDAFLAPASVTIKANASTPSGSISKVEFYNGTTLLGEATGTPYQYTWTNVAKGSYTITAVAYDNNNEKATSAGVIINVNVPQAPYGGTAHKIPGAIEFEDFDEGGNNSAYYDDSPGSETDVTYRDEDVDLEDCSDTNGGYNLGYTTAGEWVEYTVDVESAGTYEVSLRVACAESNRTLSIAAGGVTVAADIAIPNTGGWQEWTTITEEFDLSAGEQVLRFTIGDLDYVNLNNMTFVLKGEADLCPNDDNKTEPGICGCGVPEGTCDDPSVLKLKKGWNIIGFPLSGSTDIEVALSSIWTDVETVKDLESFFDKNTPAHLNILNTLEWGKGYYVKVSNDCELKFE